MQRPRLIRVNAFHFRKPVFVADLVSFYATVTQVGTTSLTVDVKVYAQRGWRSPNPGEIVLVTDALLTYVAIDDQRNKRLVPGENQD